MKRLAMWLVKILIHLICLYLESFYLNGLKLVGNNINKFNCRFSSPIDKILHKFDNFLEKVEVKLSLSDRIDLLLKSEKFDFT